MNGKQMRNLNEEQMFATQLHELCCNKDHNDQCSWFYEGNHWNGYAHRHWLEHARALMAQNVTIEMVKLVRSHTW